MLTIFGLYNLENSFDVEGSLHRSASLRSRLAREMAGWSEVVLANRDPVRIR